MIDKEKVNKLISYIVNCDVFEVVGESPWLHGVQWDGLATGEPDNQVMLINWFDAEGQEFSVILTEEGLQNATIEDNKIICKDHEGDEFEIAVYSTEPIEIIL